MFVLLRVMSYSEHCDGTGLEQVYGATPPPQCRRCGGSGVVRKEAA
jgi:DnaJ-class molecular chaperone